MIAVKEAIIALEAFIKTIRQLNVEKEICDKLNEIADNLNLPIQRLVLANYLNDQFIRGTISKDQCAKMCALVLSDNGEIVNKGRGLSNLSQAKRIDFKLNFHPEEAEVFINNLLEEIDRAFQKRT
jgi:hypothetical protein